MVAKALLKRRSVSITAAAAAAVLGLPALAFAHLERPSYWPDPAPDTTVSPAAGGEVPDARSLASAVSGRGPGKVLVVCQGDDGEESLDALRSSLREARSKGFHLRPSQPKIRLSRRQASRLLEINRDLAERLRVRLGPEGRERRRQQRPHRDHARPLRRAAVAQRARERPEVQPQPAPGDASGDLTPSYEYQVTCPNDQNLIYVQGRAVDGQAARAAADQPPRDPGPGARAVRALQPADRGHRAQARGRDPRRGQGLPGRGARRRSPAATPSTSSCAWTAPTASSGATSSLRGAREHGFYNEEVDGVLLDKVKFFWARRLRPPELHLRPQRGQELRGLRRRGRRRLPGRRARDRVAGDRLLPRRAAPEHRHQGLRPARLGARLLGLDGQRRADHQQPRLRQHDRDLERHALGGRPSRLPRRQLPDRPQLHLLQQPRPLRPEPARRAARRRCRSGPGSCTRG